jgi:hypothetical protein
MGLPPTSSTRGALRRHLRTLHRTLLALSICMACYFPTMASAGAGKNIEQTAANRICVVLIGFVVFSLGLEVGIERLEEYYEHRGREGMVEVIGKIKEEFLLVGVLSLMLMLLEDTLFAVCYQKPTAEWTPITYCPGVYSDSSSSGAGSNASTSSASSSSASSAGGSRRMLLAAAATGNTCAGTYESYAPYVEVNALHQLHLLVFWLAVGHVISTFVSYFVARFTVARWAAWENDLIENLVNHGDHIEWTPSTGAGMRSSSAIPRHMVGWKLCCCGMDGHTLLSLRRFYISRHNLSPRFKIFHMVMEDLEHDFGDFAGIRFWMWLFLAAQIFVNSSTTRVVGYNNWGNMFFALLLGAHLRSIAEDLSNQIWKHFKGEKESHEDVGAELERMDTTVRFKNDVATVNTDFSDHLESIEPRFQFGCCCSDTSWFNRPKLFMLWFQLCMWNSSSVMVQSAWYSAMGMGCYAYVRGSMVISIQIPVAAITLLHQGWVVLPLYALLLHCGEHLRGTGRKKDKARAEKKLALHRRNSISLAASTLLSSISKKSAAATGEGASNAAASATESSRRSITAAKSDGKSDGFVAAPDPGGANIGGGVAGGLNSSASKYAVGSSGEES